MSAEYIKNCLSVPGMEWAIGKYYPLVSRREKTVPNAGSPCVKVERLNRNAVGVITKHISHKNGDITIVCEAGYLRFWRDNSQINTYHKV